MQVHGLNLSEQGLLYLTNICDPEPDVEFDIPRFLSIGLPEDYRFPLYGGDCRTYEPEGCTCENGVLSENCEPFQHAIKPNHFQPPGAPDPNLSVWSFHGGGDDDPNFIYDSFGFSVSIDGDLAIVGAPYHDDDLTNSGAAYVYRWNGTSGSKRPS